MKKKKKTLSKLFLWSSLVGLCAAGATAIGFGIANFVKYGSKNKGTGYSDSLQTKLQVGIDTSNSTSSNLEDELNLIESIGNKTSLVATNIDSNEIQVQSGLSVENNDLVQNLVIGEIYLNTEANLYKFNFNFDIQGDENSTNSEIANRQAKLDLEKLNLYLTLIQNNSYQLINNNLSNPDQSSTDVNFTNIYNLNTADGTSSINAFLKNEKMFFNLKERIDNSEKNWDLSNFQKQFTNIYNWDGDLTDTTYREVINNFENDETNSNKKKEVPESSYILWKNRNGLVNLLEILATVSYLNKYLNIENTSIQENVKTRINSLYSLLIENGEYSSFMKWCEKEIDFPITEIMSKLFLSQSNDFGMSNNGNIDPLLEILNSYYINKSIENSTETTNNTYVNYEFLYSWNLNSDGFLSPYLATIDYYNWFDFFPSLATEEQQRDKEYLKNNYYANTLDVNWSVSQFGPSDVRLAVNFANNAYIEQQFINYYLLKSSVNGNYFPGVANAQNVYDQMFNGFIEGTVSLIPSKYNNSIIGINSFTSGIIAFSVLILIIAIIVSVLYKIPGALLSLSLIVSQGLTLLVLSNLSITVTINTLFAFISALFLPLIPFIYSFSKLKNAINFRKLNINNSFKVFLSSYIWMSILTYAVPLIMALVALLFGQYQIKSFGAILVIANFNSFISCFAFFLILLMISYYLFIKIKPKLILTTRDIKSLASIHNVTSFNIDSHEENIIQSKWISKINDQVANALLTKKWWTYLILGVLIALGIIGIILLAVLNNNVINFKYAKQLVLNYKNEDISNINIFIDNLTNNLNVKWNYVYTYQLANGTWEKVLISNSNLDINRVFEIANSINSTLTNSLSFRINNIYFTSLLFNNGINCLLISLAFIAILNLFMFNIINVIPMFVMQIIVSISMIGLIELLQIPINLNIIESYIVLFIVNNALINMIMFNVKKSFNLKKRYTVEEIYNFTINQIKELFTIILFLSLSFLLINIYMIIFDSAMNVFNYLINGLINIFGLIIAIILIPIWFTWTMYLREKYLAHTLNNNLENKKHKWYDKVDEQIIVGINHN